MTNVDKIAEAEVRAVLLSACKEAVSMCALLNHREMLANLLPLLRPLGAVVGDHA
jgi:hypothetical protein